MPYLRLTADRRGVENTFLLHVAAPGEKPKILYWYRTVPGVQIGRAALDDAAMRTLEEQYPEIDFDWPYILDVGAMTPVEVEAPLPPRKRKPVPPPRRVEHDAVDDDSATSRGEAAASAESTFTTGDAPVAPADRLPPGGESREWIRDEGPDLLSELLGRGIAASLRTRHADLFDAVAVAPVADDVRAAWQARLAALDPDAWHTPEAVLAGMTGADREFERLQDELDAAAPGA